MRAFVQVNASTVQEKSFSTTFDSEQQSTTSRREKCQCFARSDRRQVCEWERQREEERIVRRVVETERE